MNKYQEALSSLHDFVGGEIGCAAIFFKIDGITYEALDTVKELVEKATPKMPIKHENYRGGYYRCPTCDWNLGVLSDIELYCEKCGQALDKGKAYETD